MNKLRLIIKISCIVIVSLVMAWLFMKGMYFSSVALMLVNIVLGVSIYRDHQRLIQKMERMISSIHHGEFNFNFPEKASKDDIQHLNHLMNEALTAFRERTYIAMKEDTEIEAWQKLIRVLTHEMMNSLAPIISISETVSKQTSTNSLNQEDYDLMLKAMLTIHRRSKGLVSFIENYRQLTRVYVPVKQWISLNDFFKDLHLITTFENAVIYIDIVPQNLTLLADKTMLEQLVINLIKNAKEACLENEKPFIHIKVSKEGAKTQISIQDNGRGIVPETLDKIFIPFFSTKSGGSGIGLSLCRQIMNRHNGQIDVQSEINKGTTFTLQF